MLKQTVNLSFHQRDFAMCVNLRTFVSPKPIYIKMKKLFIFFVLILPSLVFAQWRVGVNGGADYNHFIKINAATASTYVLEYDSHFADVLDFAVNE